MSKLREDILSKYSKSTAERKKDVEERLFPTTSLVRKATTAKREVAVTTSLREGILSKYSKSAEEKKKEADEKRRKIAEESAAKAQAKKEERLSKQEIFAAPEKTFFEKAKGVVKTGLQKVGLVKKEEEILAKEQAVTILTKNLNERQYLEIGKQLGLSETVTPEFPEGITPTDQPTIDYYTDRAVIKQVQESFPELQEAFGLEQPDQLDPEFVEKHFDDITKELGVRDKMTNEEYLGLMLTLGIGAGTAGTISLGARALPTLAKLGIGLAGFEALNEADRRITKFITGDDEMLSEHAIRELDLGETGELLVYAVDLFAKGKILHSIYKKGPAISEKLTKDIIVKYNLPKEIRIEPEKIRSIFQTGEKISAEELSLVKALGLSGKEYRQAMKDGVTITVPAEKIVNLVDKPYWAKVKGLFGKAPSAEVISRTKEGEIREAPAGYIEGPSGKPISVAKPIPGEKAPKVVAALKSPVNEALLKTIEQFSEVEANAFGQKIIQRMNKELGTTFEKPSDLGPESRLVKFNDFASKDGRPAQITDGKIEVFIPSLLESIKTLAEGKTILAHPEIPKYSKVYKLQEGETMDQLASRYTKEVLIHELSHKKTMTAEDAEQGRALQAKVNEARASGNQKALTAAETAMDVHLENIEKKALEYERGNLAQLEMDLFGRKGDSTKIQRDIERELAGGPPEKVTITKKKLVKEKIKAQAKGAKAGKAAGREIGREEVKEVKTKHQEAVELMKDKTASLQRKRQALVEYAEAFLPVSIRGKFLRDIRYPGSDKNFESILSRMSKKADITNRANLVRQIQVELKEVQIKVKRGKPKSKLFVDQQRRINSIIQTQKDYELTAKRMRALGNKQANAYDIAWQKRAEIQGAWQDKHPGVSPSAEILEHIEVLRTVGLKGMTAKELRAVLSMVQSIKEKGKTTRELQQFNLTTEKQMLHGKVASDVSGGKDLPSAEQLIKQRPEDLNLKEMVKKGYGYLIYAWEDHLDKISFNDKTSLPFKSTISKEGRKIKNAAAEEFENLDKVGKEWKEGFEKAYETKTEKESLQKINEFNKKIDIGTYKNSEGKKIKIQMTLGQAVKSHMLFQNPANDKSFEAMLWTKEIKQAITDSLSPHDIAFSDYLLKDYYLNYPKRINPVHVEQTGTDLFFTDDGTYSPAFKDIESTLPASTLLAKENMAYATARTGSLKAKVKTDAILKIPDAIEESIHHMASMEHYIAYEPVLGKLRSVFANKEVRNNIEEFYGKPMLDFFDNALNDFARGGIDPAKTIKAIDIIRGNATVAMLGVFSSWKVPVKQTVSGLNFMMEISPTEFAKGTVDFWKNPIDNYTFLFENSALFRQRYKEGFDIAMKEALEKGYQTKFLEQEKVFSRETLFIGIRNADKLTVMQGAHAAYLAEYNRGIKNGLSEKDAKREGIEYAEDVIDRTQESAPIYTLSEFQRGGSIARTLSMFTSQPVKINRVISNSLRNLRAGRGNKAKLYKNLLMAWMISPFIYNTVGNMLTPEEYRDSTKELLLRSWLGPLTYVPLVGNISRAIIDKIMGKGFRTSLGDVSPTLSFADDTMNAIGKLQLEDPKIIESLSYFVDAFAKLKGWSVGLITKEVRRQSRELEKDSLEGVAAEF